MAKHKKQHRLTNEQKLFILQKLACFESPKSVIEALKDEYGVTITHQGLQNYDPDKVNGRDLSPKFVEFFNETRKRFRENLTSIPIANKAFRLQALDRMARAAEEKRNAPLAAALHEQAAKEVGDAYTNKHNHVLTGAGGGAINIRDVKDMTDAELLAIAAGSPVADK